MIWVCVSLLIHTKFRVNRTISDWHIAKNYFQDGCDIISTLQKFWIIITWLFLESNMHLHTRFHWNRMIHGWDTEKTIFKMATSAIFDLLWHHLIASFYVPNIVQNFQVNWFSTFWHTSTSTFLQVGWILPIWGQNLGFLVANKD